MEAGKTGPVAVLLLLAATASGAQEWAPPATLQDTGLYADWATKAIRDDDLPYTPQYPLWSDGAVKRRFIHVPPGTWIDASDPDAWRFPVGTKLWKEFRFHDRPVETRYIENTAEGWRYAAYVWSDDESEAVLAPERGIARSVEITDGVHHSIPSRYDCRACHEGRPVPVLGFTALQLSPDRDEGAPHAEPPRPGDLDLRVLVERGLVRGLPHRLLATPPRIAARSSTERAALGYLYANCAMCHNAAGPLSSLGLSLDAAGQGGRDAAALRSAVGQPSHFRVPGETDGRSERVRPGEPDRSAIVVRMASRAAAIQMPPLGTRLVDEDAVRLIRSWIAGDLAAMGPIGAHQGSDQKEVNR
jgi:hypothetical protein